MVRKLNPKQPDLPPTIDEKNSFHDNSRTLRQSGLADSLTKSQLFSKTAEVHDAIKGVSIREMCAWNVKWGPVKKQVVAGRLVPTVRSSISFFNQKSRRISIEIHNPNPAKSEDDTDDAASQRSGSTGGGGGYRNLLPGGGGRTAATGSTRDPTMAELQNMLGNEDTVCLSVFKKRRRSSALAQDSESDDEGSVADGSVASNGSWDSSIVSGSAPPSVIADHVRRRWRQYKHYKLEEVKIAKGFGRTLEVKLGYGADLVVRDIKFESDQEAKFFRKLFEMMNTLEQERTKRKVEEYKQLTSSLKGKKKKKDLPFGHTGDMMKILVEIVSATDVPIADISSTDAFVVARMGGKEIHQTDVISNSLDPIWTLETGSLFLLEMTPEEFFACSGGMDFIIKDYDSFSSNDTIGHVNVRLDDLLKCTGERIGYDIIPDEPTQDTDENGAGRLYLRFKEAKPDDVAFMHTYQKNKGQVGVYLNETFLPIRQPKQAILKRHVKKGPKGEKLHRVRPFPDPSRPEVTKWMTEEQIMSESNRPSTNWIENGSGDLGKVYVEILGAEDLPNMDSVSLNISDKTDAFCCMVFEDCLVNTDVVCESLNPRWMPWTQRAFAFNIAHPSSNLLLAVFDHDPENSPLQMMSRASSDLHDPIGRIEVKLSAFYAATMYTLCYPLYYGELPEHRTKTRGKIWFRLRIEWNSPQQALLAAAMPPPDSYVSVSRSIDFEVAHYVTEGVLNEKEFSMATLTRHIEELQSYEQILDYLGEAAMTVWLWRGHYRLSVNGEEVLLPLHSLLAFYWGITVTADFNKFPSFLLFSVGWIMLACHEYSSKTPSPWKKPKDFHRGFRMITSTGKITGVTILPNEHSLEAMEFDNARMKQSERWRSEKELAAKQDEELRKELGDDLDPLEDGDDIATSKGGFLKNISVNPLKPVLHPIQLQLQGYVTSLRIAKSIVMWDEALYAFWIVVLSFTGSFLIYWIPFGFLFRWTMRITAWIILGPWMALVDRYYFKEDPNMSEEEKAAIVKEKLRARYESVLEAATHYQIKKERDLKLKSMKKYMFGRFLLRVPRFSEDRFKDIPLPESYALPYDVDKSPPITFSDKKYGQQLVGDMIPKREVQGLRLDGSESSQSLSTTAETHITEAISEHSPLVSRTSNGPRSP